MPDPCSKWAYEDIIKSGYLSEKKARVLAVFTQNPDKDFTGTELATYFPDRSRSSETIRNRITELCEVGLLVKFAKKQCPVTEELVNTFKWTGRKQPLKTKEIHVRCPKCKDTPGWIKKRVPLEAGDHPELF